MYNRYIHGIYCYYPSYPYYIGDRGTDYDVVASIADPGSMWIVRPQLFFTCTVRPPHAKQGPYNKNPEDIPLTLVFFSAFEDLLLRTTGTEESNGIRKLYEPSPVPTLYVGRVDLDGNSTSTIPYKYTGRQKQAFEYGYADGQGPASRRGSHVYEINDWLWNFGRPQPRVRGLSVARTERIRRKSRSETSRRAWETRKARKMAAEDI